MSWSQIIGFFDGMSFHVVMLLVMAVGGAFAVWKQRTEWERVLSGESNQACALCNATDLDFRDELRGEYRCKGCGFDTELKQKPELAKHFELLRLADNALDSFGDALDTLNNPERYRAGSNIYTRSVADFVLEGVPDLQVTGVGWLRDLMEGLPREPRLSVPGQPGDLRALLADYFAALARGGAKPKLLSLETRETVMRRELEEAIGLCEVARGAIVAEIRRGIAAFPRDSDGVTF